MSSAALLDSKTCTAELPLASENLVLVSVFVAKVFAKRTMPQFAAAFANAPAQVFAMPMTILEPTGQR
jgi:hypothetical protein